MKNKWGGNRRKRFYSEIWENAVCVCVCVCVGGGVCVKILVSIWCMFDWILTYSCRNTLPMHK